MKVKLENPNFTQDYLRNLLAARGIENFEEFLCPTSKYLESPSNLEFVDKGVELLRDTIQENKPILLVVDCDCDGFTSSAIMYQYIKNTHPRLRLSMFFTKVNSTD